MKLLCTASKVSWFTVGREYDVDEKGRITDDDPVKFNRMGWPVERHNGGYRTAMLEDAEFSVVHGGGQVTEVEDLPFSEHESLLAAVMQMADEEGCRDAFDGYLAYFRRRYNWIPDDNKLAQRAFLLALAYFAEEQSQ